MGQCDKSNCSIIQHQTICQSIKFQIKLFKMEMIQIIEALESQGLKEEHELIESIFFVFKSYLKRKLYASNENIMAINKFEDIQFVEEEGEIMNINMPNGNNGEKEEVLDRKDEEEAKISNQKCDTKVEKSAQFVETKPTQLKGISEQVDIKVELTDAFIENVGIETKKEQKRRKSK